MNTAEIIRASFYSALSLLLISFSGNAQDLKDFDGNNYKVITYGKQSWTASNINVTHFRNGDIIPQASTQEEWANAGQKGTPAWCFYEINPENGKIYGKLYNWFAINDQRGLAPNGWHVPTTADWRTLIKNLQGVDAAALKLKSKTGWKSNPGTNAIGFTAIPAGYIDSDGKFKDLGKICQFWSNSAPVDIKPSDKIFSLKLNDKTPEVRYIQSDKGAGYSVRYVKD